MTVSVTGRFVRQTDKALCLEIEGQGQVWFPNSQIVDEDVFDHGEETVTVEVTDWIARQKGLGAGK